MKRKRLTKEERRMVDAAGLATAKRKLAELPNLPHLVTSGRYTARLDLDVGPHGHWGIYLDSALVGTLFDGYEAWGGWGNPRYSITQLVWAGPFPTGYPKNPDAALVFDGGPFMSYQKALDAFAKQADALIEWRCRNLDRPETLR